MKLEWSDDALADLDRFASFLHRQHPWLAKVVADDERLVMLRIFHGRETRE